MNMERIYHGLIPFSENRIHEFSSECRLKKQNAEPVAMGMKLMTELM